MNNPMLHTLPNGARLALRPLPTHSVALGVWLLAGSRHETPRHNGYTHLLEHLWFKGSRRYPPDILRQHFAAFGGEINAATGREISGLYGTVPAADAPLLLDIFLDLLLHPAFADAGLTAEQAVVAQEIRQVGDDPLDLIQEIATRLAWGKHPLAQPVLGDAAGRAGLRARSLKTHLRDALRGSRVVVSAAGKLDPAILQAGCAPLLALPAGEPPTVAAPRFRPGSYQQEYNGRQTYLLWLLPVPGAAALEHSALLLAGELLGGSPTARLFREVREARGLVYHLSSWLEFYHDAGLWFIAAACEPARAAECREAVEATVAELLRQGIPADELALARRQAIAALSLEEDRLENLMFRLAKEVFYRNRATDLAERQAALGRFSAADLAELIGAAWQQRLLVELVGKQ
jgi:predicted Zn-dependent peptidase